MFMFKGRKSTIIHLNKNWLCACVCVCQKECLCNKTELALSIRLLCQSYFHSLVRAVKLISNMPCVHIVLSY